MPRKDRRKKNFSPAEREVIISAMERFDARLHGAESGNTSKIKKEEILRKVTAQVNALGHEVRTPQDILKKMNDLRGVVRNKMATIAKHARGTGGGPPCPIRLSEEEEIIARCLRREQVEGLEGHDSSDPPMRTGKCVLTSIWCVACLGGGTCDKCVGPPTWDFFVSSTGVQEGAGPSSAVRPTPSPQQSATVADPLGSLQAFLEGSGQSSAQEVVEEDIAHEEVVGNEEEVAQSVQEVILFLDDSHEMPGTSQHHPITSPSGSSITLSSPSRPMPLTTSPSRPSPYSRAPGTPVPRKATHKTRGVAGVLQEKLARQQDQQSRHMGDILEELRRLNNSLSSSGAVPDALQDVAGNSAATITSLGELQTTTAELVGEVRGLRMAVQAQTACQEALLSRIAVALEGRQPAREAPGDVNPPREAPPPDAPPPPNEAPPRQARARNLGTRRSPRRGR